jgi:hypothetical protein
MIYILFVILRKYVDAGALQRSGTAPALFFAAGKPAGG